MRWFDRLRQSDTHCDPASIRTLWPRPEGPCSCGRAFALLGTIDGRVEDVFTAANGQPLPLPSMVVDDIIGLREAQVAQLAPGHFEFRLVPTPDIDLSRTRAQARHNVEKYFGPGQTVTFNIMDHIPRGPSGKLKPAILAHEPGLAVREGDQQPADRRTRVGSRIEPPEPLVRQWPVSSTSSLS